MPTDVGNCSEAQSPEIQFEQDNPGVAASLDQQAELALVQGCT